MDSIWVGIIVGGLLSQNFLLVQFLGICPFLGVSKKTDSALSMGAAVTLVMVITCLVCYPIFRYILLPLNLEYLEIIIFILVIAALVQMLEMVLKKMSPGLYSALGIYLPLVTTNCAILGVAELVIVNSVAEGFTYSYPQAVMYGLFAGLGFTLAIVLLSGLREKVDKYNLPKALKGFPITMIIACFMAMAFSIFANIG
jgi:electron transport complex protein RnfA